jgi:hypothetical protein
MSSKGKKRAKEKNKVICEKYNKQISTRPIISTKQDNHVGRDSKSHILLTNLLQLLQLTIGY